MKLAIKVLTEWDRENVISFFEKNFPECNDIHWKPWAVEIGEVWFLDETLDLVYQEYEDLSNYTILQGVPKDMELPTLEPIKTREQELEECLSVFVKVYDESVNKEYPQETINALIPFLNQATKAKQLLNK